MRRRLIQGSIVLFWLAATGWLIRYEAFPAYFVGASSGYRSLFRESPLILDSWMRIYFKGSPIGYSHTQIDTDEKDPVARFVLASQTRLELNMMGAPQSIAVSIEAALDAVYQLQHFRFTLDARPYATRVEGRRIQGDRFDVQIVSDASTRRLELRIPDDVVLYSPMTELALSRLRPGQQQFVRTLDPTSLSIIEIGVRAEERELIHHRGQEIEALRLAMDYHGLKIRSWIDAHGQLLRQETPFGWTIERCEASEALAGLGAATEDMLAALAVPVAGVIRDPAAVTRLRLRLSGADLSGFAIESDRQRLLERSAWSTDLLIAPAAADAPADPCGAEAAFRQPSPFIQSDDPDITRLAHRITGAVGDDIEKARRINQWVFKNIRKNPAVSLPSAREVLSVGEGDCNEHTYLFVALARAAGLPAKVRVGLVYLNGAFYYHAWPAVCVGRWRDLDPTFGQDEADATHVALLEGELADQVKLAGLIGRLRAEILEERYD
jgi:hypothetical protein